MAQTLFQRLEFEFDQSAEAPAIKAEDVWVRVEPDTRKQLDARLSEDYSLTSEFEDWTFRNSGPKNATFNNINITGSLTAENQIVVGNLITFGNNIILNADYYGTPEEAQDVKIIVNRGGPEISPGAGKVTPGKRYVVKVLGNSGNDANWNTLATTTMSNVAVGDNFVVAANQGDFFTAVNFGASARLMLVDSDDAVDRAIIWEEGGPFDMHGKWQFTNDGMNYINMDDPYGRPYGFGSAVKAEIPHREIVLNSDKTDGGPSITDDVTIKVKRNAGTATIISPDDTLIANTKYVVSVVGTATGPEWGTVFVQSDGVTAITTPPSENELVVVKLGQTAGFTSAIFGTARLTLPPDSVLGWSESGDAWQFSNDGATYKDMAGLEDIAIKTNDTGTLISNTIAGDDNLWVEDKSVTTGSKVRKINRSEFLGGYLASEIGDEGQSLLVKLFNDLIAPDSSDFVIHKTYVIVSLGNGDVDVWKTVGLDSGATAVAAGDVVIPDTTAKVAAYTASTFGAASVRRLDVGFGWPEHFRGQFEGNELVLNRTATTLADFTITVNGDSDDRSIKWDNASNKWRFSNNGTDFKDFAADEDINPIAKTDSTTRWPDDKLPANVLYGDSLPSAFSSQLQARLVPVTGLNDTQSGVLVTTRSGNEYSTRLLTEIPVSNIPNIDVSKINGIQAVRTTDSVTDYLVQTGTGNREYTRQEGVPASDLTGTIASSILPNIPIEKIPNIDISKIIGMQNIEPSLERQHQIIRVNDNGNAFEFGPLHIDNVDGTPNSVDRLAGTNGQILVLGDNGYELGPILPPGRSFPTDVNIVNETEVQLLETGDDGPLINKLNVFQRGTLAVVTIPNNKIGDNNDVTSFYAEGSGGVLVKFPDEKRIPSQLIGRGEIFTIMKFANEWRPLASGNDINDRYSTVKSLLITDEGRNFGATTEDIQFLNTIVFLNTEAVGSATLTLTTENSSAGNSMILYNNTGSTVIKIRGSNNNFKGLGDVDLQPGRYLEVIRVKNDANTPSEIWFASNGWENALSNYEANANRSKNLSLDRLDVHTLVVSGTSNISGSTSDGMGSRTQGDATLSELFQTLNHGNAAPTGNAGIRVNRGEPIGPDNNLLAGQAYVIRATGTANLGQWQAVFSKTDRGPLAAGDIAVGNNVLVKSGQESGFTAAIFGAAMVESVDAELRWSNANSKLHWEVVNVRDNSTEALLTTGSELQAAKLAGEISESRLSKVPMLDSTILSEPRKIPRVIASGLGIEFFSSYPDFPVHGSSIDLSSSTKTLDSDVAAEAAYVNKVVSVNPLGSGSVLNMSPLEFGANGDEIVLRNNSNFIFNLRGIHLLENTEENMAVVPGTYVWLEKFNSKWRVRNIFRTTGIETLGSFPSAVERQRASAGDVLVLNAAETGYELTTIPTLPASIANTARKSFLVVNSDSNPADGTYVLQAGFSADDITEGTLHSDRLPASPPSSWGSLGGGAVAFDGNLASPLNALTLHSGRTEIPHSTNASADARIIVDRGDFSNTEIWWDESDWKWKIQQPSSRTSTATNPNSYEILHGNSGVSSFSAALQNRLVPDLGEGALIRNSGGSFAFGNVPVVNIPAITTDKISNIDTPVANTSKRYAIVGANQTNYSLQTGIPGSDITSAISEGIIPATIARASAIPSVNVIATANNSTRWPKSKLPDDTLFATSSSRLSANVLPTDVVYDADITDFITLSNVADEAEQGNTTRWSDDKLPEDVLYEDSAITDFPADIQKASNLPASTEISNAKPGDVLSVNEDKDGFVIEDRDFKQPLLLSVESLTLTTSGTPVLASNIVIERDKTYGMVVTVEARDNPLRPESITNMAIFKGSEILSWTAVAVNANISSGDYAAAKFGSIFQPIALSAGADSGFHSLARTEDNKLVIWSETHFHDPMPFRLYEIPFDPVRISSANVDIARSTPKLANNDAAHAHLDDDKVYGISVRSDDNVASTGKTVAGMGVFLGSDIKSWKTTTSGTALTSSDYGSNDKFGGILAHQVNDGSFSFMRLAFGTDSNDQLTVWTENSAFFDAEPIHVYELPLSAESIAHSTDVVFPSYNTPVLALNSVINRNKTYGISLKTRRNGLSSAPLTSSEMLIFKGSEILSWSAVTVGTAVTSHWLGDKKVSSCRVPAIRFQSNEEHYYNFSRTTDNKIAFWRSYGSGESSSQISPTIDRIDLYELEFDATTAVVAGKTKEKTKTTFPSSASSVSYTSPMMNRYVAVTAEGANLQFNDDNGVGKSGDVVTFANAGTNSFKVRAYQPNGTRSAKILATNGIQKVEKVSGLWYFV